VLEQVIQGVLEGLRQQLLRQIDRQQSRTRIDVLSSGPRPFSICRHSYFGLDARNRSA